MLVLSRKVGERVTIGDTITLTVVAVSGKTVRVGFEAPDVVRILRSELTAGQDEPRRSKDHRAVVLQADLQHA